MFCWSSTNGIRGIKNKSSIFCCQSSISAQARTNSRQITRRFDSENSVQPEGCERHKAGEVGNEPVCHMKQRRIRCGTLDRMAMNRHYPPRNVKNSMGSGMASLERDSVENLNPVRADVTRMVEGNPDRKRNRNQKSILRVYVWKGLVLKKRELGKQNVTTETKKKVNGKWQRKKRRIKTKLNHLMSSWVSCVPCPAVPPVECLLPKSLLKFVCSRLMQMDIRMPRWIAKPRNKNRTEENRGFLQGRVT